MMLPPPLVHQARADVPVLLSIPHAGRDYPDWLLALSSGGKSALYPLEDPLVDQLAQPAIRDGFGAVVARAPRAAIDCNRAEDEIDPTVISMAPLASLSPRARGGLGIVPGRTLSHGPLWRRPISPQQLEERLDQVHRPYHRALAEGLKALRARFGCVLLLDCHSMPPLPDAPPAIVLGNRHGRSAGSWLTSQAMKIVASAGFRVALNEPFAGGYILDRHGAPEAGVHALQVEIDRRFYLRDGITEPGAGFGRTAELIGLLARQLGDRLLARSLPTAAE